MLRLAKLGRMSLAWRHIAEAVRSRRVELGLTLAMAAAALLISATLLYWAEADAQPSEFGSIPRSLWWAVATLTTVGYGDAVPVTALGRLLSSIVAVVGIALIALPTGRLAAAFSDAMQRQRRDAKEASAEAVADADL
jgi:voltage-gated potassium channel